MPIARTRALVSSLLSGGRMTYRGAASAFSFALSLSWSVASSAQIAVVEPRSLLRVGPRGEPLAKRPAELRPEGVSYRDCVEDQRLRVPLEIRGLSEGDRIEVWAAAAPVDCATAKERRREGRCVRIRDDTAAPALELTIPVQRIAWGALHGSGRTNEQDARVCGAVDRSTIRLHVLGFASSSKASSDADVFALPTMGTHVDIEVDTVASPAPRDVHVSREGEGMVVSWGALEPSWAGDVVRTRVYCAPNDEANEDGCSSSVFALGVVPDEAMATRALCATMGSTTTRVTVDSTPDGESLSPSTSYTFAVSSVDGFGNESPLASQVCAMTSYEGGCVVAREEHPRRASPVIATGALTLGLAFAIRRARRRPARDRSGPRRLCSSSETRGRRRRR